MRPARRMPKMFGVHAHWMHPNTGIWRIWKAAEQQFDAERGCWFEVLAVRGGHVAHGLLRLQGRGRTVVVSLKLRGTTDLLSRWEIPR